MLVLVDTSYNLHDKSEKTKKKLTKAIFSLQKYNQLKIEIIRDVKEDLSFILNIASVSYLKR